LAPACSAESRTALFSTSVIPEGMQTTMRSEGAKKSFGGVNHANHTPYHVLGSVEIGDDPIPQGSDRLDVLVRFSMHLLGLLANCNHLAGVSVKGHNRRLVHHNGVLVNNQCIRSAQVNRYLLRKKVK